MSDKKKRISVHNLVSGMILAEEIVTLNGQLFIPKDTVITEHHLFRMNLYQVLSVVIYEESDINADDRLLDTPEMVHQEPMMMSKDLDVSEIRLNRTENFLRFNKAFMRVDHILREHFDAIVTGAPVEGKKLLTATESLMKSVRLKSDLFTYMSHIHSDDYHTYVHSVNVSILCNIFGEWLKLTESEIEELTIAALIHDIGKTMIPTALLNKSEKLTEEEYNQVHKHAQLGYEIIRNSNLSDQIKNAVLLHHERNDGSGYPFGYTSEEIPDFAKIIAIADVYNAMTSNRSYHQKFSPFKVIQLFEQESYGYLDTKFLFIFLENIAHYYLGEEVRLNNGMTGKIVFIHNQSPSRPIIQMEDTMVDLMTTPELAIEEIL